MGKDLLEDLEISVQNHNKLFDIIDSNGSGSLDIGELIEGLMKLRGPADKGDIVCASLMVRSTQRHLRKVEADMFSRFVALDRRQNEVLKSLSNIERKVSKEETQEADGRSV